MANYEKPQVPKQATDSDAEYTFGLGYADVTTPVIDGEEGETELLINAPCFSVNGKLFALRELELSGAEKSGLKAIHVKAIKHYLKALGYSEV